MVIEIVGGGKKKTPETPVFCPEVSTVHLVMKQQQLGALSGLAGAGKGGPMVTVSQEHIPALLPCQMVACAKWCSKRQRCGAVCGCGSCGWVNGTKEGGTP